MSHAVLQGLKLGETFDVQREWCADLVKAPEALPRARVVFISGSQNEQTSSDLGRKKGGAFTSYALEHWDEKDDKAASEVTVAKTLQWMLGLRKGKNGGGGWDRGAPSSLFNRFKSMLKDFKRHGFPQEPNVCMWPSMSDSVDFDPFTPPSDFYGTGDYDIARRPFAGGPRPSRGADMVVPPICHHGGREEKAEAIKGQSVGFHHLDIQEGLRLAAEPYHEAGPCEGWDTRYKLRLSPSAGNAGHNGITLSETAPDVVSYVDPLLGRLAGVRIGDIIRSVGGKSFSEMSAQAKRLALRRGGQLVVLGTRG
uniref:PDZ domain-containing protein n=1 Tax=Alexandrium catenella TaxID=2925 RepID=A0A7S1Q7S8_ALECA